MLDDGGLVIKALDSEVEFDGVKYDLEDTRQLENFIQAYNAANDEGDTDIDSVAEARPAPDGREDFDIGWTTTTLETVTVTEAAGLKATFAGNEGLASIDAGDTSGNITLIGLGNNLTSYTGSAGKDDIEFSGFAAAGVAVDLGAGNDIFADAGGNSRSRIEGGQGTDKLVLTQPGLESITYMDDDGNRQLIYSGFEILDVSGGAGVYDLAMLGFDEVEVHQATGEDVITLMNATAGTGLTVSGRGGGATRVILELADAGPGSIFGTARGEIFTLSLLGSANLRFTPDRDIEVMKIESKSTFSNFNRVVLYDGLDENDNPAIGDSLEEIEITGSARLVLEAAPGAEGDDALANLNYVNASGATGGVTVNLAGNGSAVEILGGSAGDRFTGGAQADTLAGNRGRDTLVGGDGNDTLSGGAGADTLTGGSGANQFIYASVAESLLRFNSNDDPFGMDTITDWDAGAGNRILLPVALFESLRGTIKNAQAAGADAFWAITAADTDDNPDSLNDFVTENADGFFETGGVPRTDGQFGNTPIVQHPIAVVVQTQSGGQRTWIFIDTDGDGDFDAANDMVIALTGRVDVEAEDFAAAT